MGNNNSHNQSVTEEQLIKYIFSDDNYSYTKHNNIEYTSLTPITSIVPYHNYLSAQSNSLSNRTSDLQRKSDYQNSLYKNRHNILYDGKFFNKLLWDNDVAKNKLAELIDIFGEPVELKKDNGGYAIWNKQLLQSRKIPFEFISVNDNKDNGNDIIEMAIYYNGNDNNVKNIEYAINNIKYHNKDKVFTAKSDNVKKLKITLIITLLYMYDHLTDLSYKTVSELYNKFTKKSDIQIDNMLHNLFIENNFPKMVGGNTERIDYIDIKFSDSDSDNVIQHGGKKTSPHKSPRKSPNKSPRKSSKTSPHKSPVTSSSLSDDFIIEKIKHEIVMKNPYSPVNDNVIQTISSYDVRSDENLARSLSSPQLEGGSPQKDIDVDSPNFADSDSSDFDIDKYNFSEKSQTDKQQIDFNMNKDDDNYLETNSSLQSFGNDSSSSLIGGDSSDSSANTNVIQSTTTPTSVEYIGGLRPTQNLSSFDKQSFDRFDDDDYNFGDT